MCACDVACHLCGAVHALWLSIKCVAWCVCVVWWVCAARGVCVARCAGMGWCVRVAWLVPAAWCVRVWLHSFGVRASVRVCVCVLVFACAYFSLACSSVSVLVSAALVLLAYSHKESMKFILYIIVGLIGVGRKCHQLKRKIPPFSAPIGVC